VFRVRNVIGFPKRDESTEKKQSRISSVRMTDQAEGNVLVRALAVDVLLKNFSQPVWNP